MTREIDQLIFVNENINNLIMDYHHIINQHLEQNNYIAPCNPDYSINHDDAITILSHFHHTNNCKLAHSLYFIALTFGFWKQLEKKDRIYIQSKHSYDDEILSEYTYPYSFFVRYLHAIVRRHHFEPISLTKDRFAITALEKLLMQIDNNLDEMTLKYNSLLGNCPNESIYYSNSNSGFHT